jgi:hypothetical protein
MKLSVLVPVMGLLGAASVGLAFATGVAQAELAAGSLTTSGGRAGYFRRLAPAGPPAGGSQWQSAGSRSAQCLRPLAAQVRLRGRYARDWQRARDGILGPPIVALVAAAVLLAPLVVQVLNGPLGVSADRYRDGSAGPVAPAVRAVSSLRLTARLFLWFPVIVYVAPLALLPWLTGAEPLERGMLAVLAIDAAVAACAVRHLLRRARELRCYPELKALRAGLVRVALLFTAQFIVTRAAGVSGVAEAASLLSFPCCVALVVYADRIAQHAASECALLLWSPSRTFHVLWGPLALAMLLERLFPVVERAR